jgi:hypothetical protein
MDRATQHALAQKKAARRAAAAASGAAPSEKKRVREAVAEEAPPREKQKKKRAPAPPVEEEEEEEEEAAAAGDGEEEALRREAFGEGEKVTVEANGILSDAQFSSLPLSEPTLKVRSGGSAARLLCLTPLLRRCYARWVSSA